jgi:hypothetical protein
MVPEDFDLRRLTKIRKCAAWFVFLSEAKDLCFRGSVGHADPSAPVGMTSLT